MKWRTISRRRRRFAAAAAVLSLTIAAAWTAVPGATAGPRAADGAIRVRVMSFNIWYGGFRTGLDGVADAIRAARADVVGLQEPYGNTRRIAKVLGWYAAPELHTISRFPIVQPPGSQGLWGYVLVEPGRVVAIANTHNPCCPYGPNWVRVGRTKSDVLELENRLRLPWQQEFLDALAPLVEAGEPVFFTGDFNSPSWRDWTREVVEAQGWQPATLKDKGPRYPVRWPTSLAMEAAGFRDSYREAHPDPIADPGYTWTAGHPGLSPWDIFDRIDFVWAAGPATTISSAVVGPDDRDTAIVSEPWPSDHRAVVSAFEVTPAAAPVFASPLATPARLGKPLDVAFHAPAGSGRTVGIWEKEADPAGAPAIVSAPLDPASAEGTVELSTEELASGVYALALVRDGSLISRVVFDAVDPGAPTTIETSARRYRRGEPIVVSWDNGPGNRFDWLSVNPAGVDPAVGRLWQWRYIDGRVRGTARITRESVGNWPLPTGAWQVHLCIDDDYVCVASSEPFRIVAG